MGQSKRPFYFVRIIDDLHKCSFIIVGAEGQNTLRERASDGEKGSGVGKYRIHFNTLRVK